MAGAAGFSALWWALQAWVGQRPGRWLMQGLPVALPLLYIAGYDYPALRTLWANGVLAVQLGLGLSNVYFHLPLPVAVAHNAGGAALLLTLVLVNYHARTSLVRVRHQVPFGWRFSPR
eukprot:gene10544-13379_t